MSDLVFIIGTRPEAIKLLPLYALFKKQGMPVQLWLSMQHKELVIDLLNVFDCSPDLLFEQGTAPRTLNSLCASILTQCQELFEHHQPSWIFVQGDTATVFASALAAFNASIHVAHIEAGLRTYNLAAPYPEEGYRQMVSRIATINYAPTHEAALNLASEGIPASTIHITGNTVVDALLQTQARINSKKLTIVPELHSFCTTAQQERKKLFLLTAHRRESHGKPLETIFRALLEFLKEHPDVACVYATHPNPAVKHALITSGFIDEAGSVDPSITSQVFYTQPLMYPELVYTLDHVDCVVTDSGGIQEEAIALGKNVVCLRETTERPEGIELGLTTLVGANPQALKAALVHALHAPRPPSTAHTTVYGDGTACHKIFQHFISIYAESSVPSAPRTSAYKPKEKST